MSGSSGARRADRRPGALAGLLVALAGFAPTAGADQARLLATNREAAEARVEMVLASEHEVFASSFILGDDPFTLTVLALLRDTARRGVHVQLLVDAQWNKVPRPVLALLLGEKVEIREYHRFRVDRLGWIFRRMHDKLVVTDESEVVAGGRNVESTYFGFGRQVHRRDYLDLDLQVKGEAAAEASAYFRRIWASRHVSPVRAEANAAELASAAQLLDQNGTWLARRIEEAKSDPDRLSARLAEVGRVEFLHDPIGDKTKSATGVGPELRDLLGAARKSALIESPYLILSRALRKSLLDALARGARVRILTNSLSTTDNLWAQAGYVGHRKELVAAGLELWEYHGPECLHSKAAVFDDETVIVGSYNLDPRSERLNTETALVAHDVGLAHELTSLFGAHLTSAWRIDARGWPEGADRPYPGASGGKVFQLQLMRLFVPFFKGQL